MIHVSRPAWPALSRLGKILSLVLAAAIVAGVAVYAACPASWVLVSDGPRAADAIVILGGDEGERTARALELFKQGLAPRIIITGESKMGMVTNCFRAAGVPTSVLTVEPMAGSTYENAQSCEPILRQWNARATILVTSWYHSRRALVTFQRRMPDLRFISAPACCNRKTDRFAKLRVRIELGKLLGYWIVHGIPPWRANLPDFTY